MIKACILKKNIQNIKESMSDYFNHFAKVIKVSTILKIMQSNQKKKSFIKKMCCKMHIRDIKFCNNVSLHIYIRYVLSDMYYTHNKLPNNHWTFLLTHMNKRFGRNLWNASIWHFVCSCFCSVWRWLAIFYWETFRVSN